MLTTSRPSRFGRDTSRNSLFSNYDARSSSPSKQKSHPHSRSPQPSSSYGYGYPGSQGSSDSPSFSAYPGTANGGSAADGGPGYRTATPNSRGQYSASTLDELESQNDEHVGILTGKVRELKNVSAVLLSSRSWASPCLLVQRCMAG